MKLFTYNIINLALIISMSDPTLASGKGGGQESCRDSDSREIHKTSPRQSPHLSEKTQERQSELHFTSKKSPLHYEEAKKAFESDDVCQKEKGRTDLHTMALHPEVYFNKKYQNIKNGDGCWNELFIEPIELRLNALTILIEKRNNEDKKISLNALNDELEQAVHFVRFGREKGCCGFMREERGKVCLELIAKFLMKHPVSYEAAEQCYEFGSNEYAREALHYFAHNDGKHQLQAAIKTEDIEIIRSISNNSNHLQTFTAAKWLFRKSDPLLKADGEKSLKNISKKEGDLYQEEAKQILSSTEECTII